MVYRYWCGDCSFKTPWLEESEGLRQQIEHYAARHPGTPPGGQIESRRGDSGGARACLQLAAIALVLLAILAACRH
ncbi:hypothetical protein [Streptomyces sindenensis]|uniref:Uncharacterized protein n=1 Tax=Streptomyces sindenensis TaxID=67363 RepID=A0ABW6EDX1_9ACTN|nr:hypothetical protein [Streptomyces sindenensis]GGP59621.1 hypothetical protein GCM10010231_33170 [Streptomyces sindenensis]